MTGRRGGERKRIVIIDDNRLLNAAFVEGLSRFLEGAEVSCYANVEAWLCAGRSQHDVFVVGQKMGAGFMDGDVGARIIRALYPDVFIIGWSADRGLENAFFEAGADAFLSKPCDFDEIIALLE